jgi:hypothetical protein
MMLTENDKKIIKLRLRETHKIMDRKAEERRSFDVKHVQFFAQKDSVPVNGKDDWFCPECGTMNHVHDFRFTPVRRLNPYANDICSGCGRSFLLDF